MHGQRRVGPLDAVDGQDGSVDPEQVLRALRDDAGQDVRLPGDAEGFQDFRNAGHFVGDLLQFRLVHMDVDEGRQSDSPARPD